MTRHDSMRGWFAYELYLQMEKNPNIYLILGDLGYKVFDAIRAKFPDRVINTGAAEQAMVGIAVGLALEGKIPIVYSISTFLLFRPFEAIRLYINHERIPVKLVGSGRQKDYAHDGISHWMFEDDIIFRKVFKNIQMGEPQEKEDIPLVMEQILKYKKPYYITLTR